MYGGRRSRGVRAGELHEGELCVAGVLSVCRWKLRAASCGSGVFFGKSVPPVPGGTGELFFCQVEAAIGRVLSEGRERSAGLSLTCFFVRSIEKI